MAAMMGAFTTGMLLGGRYEVTSVQALNSSLAMGEAVDRQGQSPVTVHLFHSNVSASVRWRESFAQEAARLAAVPDLGQPRVLDHVMDSVACLVCAPVPGDPLVRPGEVQGPSRVVAWSLDIASLLDQLHALPSAVFVRCSRPETLWLKHDGSATLLRYGVPEPPAATTLTSDVSPFRAPETMGNATRELTAAADVYWLGACMLLALSGSPPMSALDRAAKALPLTRPPSCPEELWALLQSMLAIKPGERPLPAAVYKKLLLVRC